MESNLVQVQFKDSRSDNFTGRAYTYVADVPLSVGDIVKAPTARGDAEVRVCRVDVPDNELPAWLGRDKLSHITEPGTPGGNLFAGFFD